MSFMPPTDSMFLLGESREHPMHVGGLHLYRSREHQRRARLPGRQAGLGFPSGTGGYTIGGLPPGTYFALALGGSTAENRVYGSPARARCRENRRAAASRPWPRW